MPTLPTLASFRGSRPSPARLRAAVEIALVLVLAVQTARLIWLVLAPNAPIGMANTAADAAANPTATAKPLAFDPFFRSDAAPTASAAGYTLHGLRRGPAGDAAILAGGDGVQAAYAVGDALPDGSVLAAVAADHVVLRAGGVQRRLSLPDVAPATGSAATAPMTTLPTSPVAASAPRAGEPVDPQRLLAQTALRARSDNGRVTGYELMPKGDGALLRQAGLQPGDVLLAVDGNALTPERMSELERELAGRDRVELTVQRDGRTETITLQTRLP